MTPLGINNTIPIKLNVSKIVNNIQVTNRYDCNQNEFDRILGCVAYISADKRKWKKLHEFDSVQKEYELKFKSGKSGRYIKIESPNGNYLHLRHMKVFGR